jgi:hypothetical protein
MIPLHLNTLFSTGSEGPKTAFDKSLTNGINFSERGHSGGSKVDGVYYYAHNDQKLTCGDRERVHMGNVGQW